MSLSCSGARRSLRASGPRGPAAAPTTRGGSRRNHVVTHQWRPAHLSEQRVALHPGSCQQSCWTRDDYRCTYWRQRDIGHRGEPSRATKEACRPIRTRPRLGRKRPLADGLVESRDQYGDGRNRRSGIAPVGGREIVDRGERRRAIDRQLRIKCRRTRRARRWPQLPDGRTNRLCVVA